MVKIRSSEITPEHVYLSRRKFMRGLGAVALGSVALAACGVQSANTGQAGQPSSGVDPIQANEATQIASGEYSTAGDNTSSAPAGAPTPYPSGKAEALTSYDDITHYNNYYEFSEDKEPPADMAKNFKTRPWSVQVGGFVNNPKTYAIDDLVRKFPQQERVYRLRCVEGWSMVIPWTGFPLNMILKEASPTAKGKYVRFTSIMAADQMPGQQDPTFQWPYIEGLRVDEAMNDLALVVTGMYGKTLPNQDGAPLRMAVPWKYGFKSAKAIVKIDLVESQPTTLWMAAAPDEYGFYSNVNPNRPHPRWSQQTERRIGEAGRRKTIIFNGYGDEVAHLYDGMDLIKYY